MASNTNTPLSMKAKVEGARGSVSSVKAEMLRSGYVLLIGVVLGMGLHAVFAHIFGGNTRQFPDGILNTTDVLPVQQPLVQLVLPPRPEDLPYFDMLLVIFTGEDEAALKKRERLRKVYWKYGGKAPFVSELGVQTNYTVKFLFLAGSLNCSTDGDLAGDVFTVLSEPGYRNIVQKTKGMMSLVKHFNFKYLMKADDDTFVCLKMVAEKLHNLPEAVQPKVYAGVPTACNIVKHHMVGRVITDPTNRWYDEKYISHTLGSLQCYPPYHQGAFYVLSKPLCAYLESGKEHLLTFVNEDVTIGTWLTGVDREIVELNNLEEARLWECSCASTRFARQQQASKRKITFFHACKRLDQLERCERTLGRC